MPSYVIEDMKDQGRLQDEDAGAYTFHFMKSEFEGLNNKDVKEHFLKWGIDQSLKVAKFRFDQPWSGDENPESLLLDFLNSGVVQDNIEVKTKAGWGKTGIVKEIKVESIKATNTTTAVFDDLLDSDIATEDGRIKKCMPDDFEGIAIEDELRKGILDEDSDSYEAIPDELREEFIFHLFKHFVFGGTLNQYEEMLQPYIDTVKDVYKDLMSVKKNTNTGKIEIASKAFAIRQMKTSAEPLFPKDSPLNLCFAIVDPFRRHLIWYYFSYASSGGW